jgi:uncharacterized integral membrane protein
MDEKQMIECIFWIFLAGGAVITASSLATKTRRKQDWFMSIGGLMVTVSGMVFVLGAFEHVDFNFSETIGMATAGALGFGLLLFVMGFCFDQLQVRRIVKLQKEAELINRAQS